MNDIKQESENTMVENLNEHRKKLQSYFLAAFPFESLQDMTLKLYSNLDKKDSFCYWLESKTSELGSIWGGSSYKFGIYEYKNKPNTADSRITSDNHYAWYTKYGKDTAQEAFAVVKEAIIKIATEAIACNFKAIDTITELGDVYKWKIAFLYSNNNLVPIYKREMLTDLAQYFGMKGTEKAPISQLQSFILGQKGEKDIFAFYDELLTILSKHKKTTYWIYSPGEKSSNWENNLATGTMSIGWDFMGDISEYTSRNEIKKALQDYYHNQDNMYSNDSLALWNFVHKLKVGDIVYVKKGVNKIIGKGIVEGDYIYDESQNFPNIRKVNWIAQGEWEHSGNNVQKTLTDITPYHDFIKEIDDLISSNNKQQYWWLVAKPKIWSLAQMKVGDVQSYTLYSERGNKRNVFQNFLNANKGDIVLGYEATPTKQIVAILEIEKPSDGQELYFKKIESLPDSIDYSTFKDIPELSEMEFLKKKNGSLFKLTAEEYDCLMEIICDANPSPKEAEPVPAYTKDDFLDEVFMDDTEYSKLRSLLQNKKNIILQGAPGVGKTFSAKRLAYSMMGEKDEKKIEFIQFHQNYSYEDFIMGYRPNDDGGFELKKGVFYKFCKTAQSDPGNDYFFIIDEINRGNLSKIFGELLMLIERDYRNTEIKLAYNGESFSVPDNLYIIGMMNTADRSLAMIDYALRRRFSFFEMKPGFATRGFKKYQEAIGDDKFDNVINAIISLNTEIERDDSLGSGFCIGHSYFCTNNPGDISEMWLENIIEYDIKPMLREYWFDNDSKYMTEVNKLLALFK